MKEKITGLKSNYKVSTEVTNTIGDFCVVKATVSKGGGASLTIRTAHSSGSVDKIEAVEEKAINRAISLLPEPK